MLSKKHEHWRYEQEVRTIIPFPRKVMDDNLIFTPFGDKFSLSEIMLGLRCATSVKNIKSCLGNERQKCQIYRMEMSPTEYAMQLPQVFA